MLRYSGVAGIAGFAGCLGNDEGDDGDGSGGGDGGDGTDGGDGSDGDGSANTGGKPVIGLAAEPKAFNPLVNSQAEMFAILDQFYQNPTVRDLETPSETTGWMFQDYSFDPDSLNGTFSVSEELTWSDGTDFTAEDVAWTFGNYLQNNEGHRYEADVAPIKDIGTTGDYEGEFTLSRSAAAIFVERVGVFSVPVLPKHIWSEVDDYTKFSPTELVGSGGYKWGDADPGNWYEIEARDDFPLHDGPFVDALRFRVYGSANAMMQGLQNGEIDMPYRSITPDQAAQIAGQNDIKIWESPSEGYNYVAFNMRRVPFDDKPFRQAMSYIYPYDYLVNDLRRGKATKGDYVAAEAWETGRPESFDEPFDHGPYQTDSGKTDYEQAREHLENAEGKHDYSFGSVESSQVTGDVELRINGQTLPEAHTDNDGNTGNGALDMVMTPPSEAPVAAKATARFVENLNEIGIPAEKRPVDSNTQDSVIWQEEDFDMWESGWIWMIPPDFSMDFWLLGSNADMDSSSSDIHLNPMGYEGANEAIQKSVETFETDAQIEATKEALATIYEDHPVLVTEYPDRINATSGDYTGFVKFPGGIAQNVYTYLNIQPSQ